MNLFKKAISILLCFVLVLSLGSVSVFAESVSIKDSIKTFSSYSEGVNKITFVFTIPQGLEEIRGIQFKIELPQGIEVSSVDKELPDNWTLRENIKNSGRIMLNSSDYSKLEEIYSPKLQYNLLTISLKSTEPVPCDNQVVITVEDITSKNDASNINSTPIKSDFSYHTIAESKKDAENHWNVCQCGEKFGLEEHKYNIQNNNAQDHWNECACGEIDVLSIRGHGFTQNYDAQSHWIDCNECGYIEEGSKENHIYSGIYIYSEKQHGMACYCGVVDLNTLESHTFIGATCTTDGQCVCGEKGGKLSHKYSTSYTSDGTYHWKKCSCGAITAKAKHTSKTSVTKKAKTSANGTQVTTCSTCKKTLKTTTIYKASSVKLSTTEYEYNGKTKKPSVKVYDSKGKKLVYGTDYTYKRPSSSKKVGKYSIKVTFKGKYTGTKTLYYTINPADTKITSLKAGSKKLTVKWSKKTKYSTGYQIQYSTSSKFSSKYTETVTIKKDTTTSKTISKLKAKKKYYVRVRCYYGTKTKYYSDWSSKKSTTTKK